MDWELRLESTYRTNGFFNVPVRWANQVRDSNGDVTLILGESGPRVRGRVDLNANSNRTPRVHGNKPLRDWFQQFPEKSIVMVSFISPIEMRLCRQRDWGPYI